MTEIEKRHLEAIKLETSFNGDDYETIMDEAAKSCASITEQVARERAIGILRFIDSNQGHPNYSESYYIKIYSEFLKTL